MTPIKNRNYGMVQVLYNWYKRYFSNPEAVILFLAIIFALLLIKFMGQMLAPVFASVVISYLLQWIVARLEASRMPHFLAVLLVYIGFLGLLVSLLGIFPLLWQQMVNLARELPNMVGHGQQLLMHLPEQYPDYISPEQLVQLLGEVRGTVTQLGQSLLSLSIASIPGLMMLSVYLVLVPLLVYFFLMDRAAIIGWFVSYMPRQRRLISQVWAEVHEQIGNYIRGKILEIMIVGIVCYIVFSLMQLQYAFLLAALVGLSVIIPYIGAVLVTIPIMVIAFLQWGWTAYFAYFMLAYGIIIAIDANVLVPLLFSEVVKLHPVAIIIAVLVFGGLWGFWGVFFAIPLASFVKAVLTAWPEQAVKKARIHE
jgi:putative permease